MSSLAKQKQEKQMNGYLLSFGVCAAAAFFFFLPFLVVDKGLFQYLCSCSSSAWRGWARIPI